MSKINTSLVVVCCSTNNNDHTSSEFDNSFDSNLNDNNFKNFTESQCM